MIKVLEKNYLDDKFINKVFVSNISINDKIDFNKNNIYYFGNYEDNKLNEIKKKILKNKKNIINAVEKEIKIIIAGNSCELFNNKFNNNDINLFTYIPHNLKLKSKKLKKIKYNNKIKVIDNLDYGICADNFRYKNLICITKEGKINKIIKRRLKNIF